jgi:septum formation protein
MKLARPLVLASASPRRREILAKLGLSFEVRVTDLDESLREHEDPVRYVARLAAEKARAACSGAREAVLGADTTVVLNNKVLGKPADLTESEQMLRALRGQEHVVHTGVALVLAPEHDSRVPGQAAPELSVYSVVVSTRVRFRAFGDHTLHAYVASREGMDKAGSYGIQELGAALVSEVQGSYSNVVGLPAAETIELLEEAGVLEAWP